MENLTGDNLEESNVTERLEITETVKGMEASTSQNSETSLYYNQHVELKKLRFDNPGDAMSELGVSLIFSQQSKRLMPRPKRAGVTAKNYNEKQKRPYHNRLGNLVASDGKIHDICDCLKQECPGCHWPCRKCGSQKCSFRCRIGRNVVISYVEHTGSSQKETNPFLTPEELTF